MAEFDTVPLDNVGEDLDERLDLLRRVIIFFGMPEKQLRALAYALEPEVARSGHELVRQGDGGDTMYIVKSGRCEVFVSQGEGREIPIAFLSPGDFFGEMALLRGEPRSATVRMQEETNLLVLDRATLDKVMPPGSEARRRMEQIVDQRKLLLQNLRDQERLGRPGEPGAVFAVYSPKGGAGRTLLALNLASALAGRTDPQKRYGDVLLLDLSMPYNHAALFANLIPTSSLAKVSQASNDEEFEEELLEALLPHASGLMMLCSVLRPEQSDLVTEEVVGHAIDYLRNTFTYIVVDLPVGLSSSTLAVLDRSQQVVLLTTPEISALKDTVDVISLFTEVLKLVPGQIMLALNRRTQKAVISKEDIERETKMTVALEVPYDANRPDDAAMKGEILFLTDPRSEVTRAVIKLSAMIINRGKDDKKRR